MIRSVVIGLLLTGNLAEAKVFRNSYLSIDLPENWACVQEGVAWTCTPTSVLESKQAVIVLASKVAGPEDNLVTFLNHLKKPKTIATKVGTPMPSQVMYAQQRTLSGMPFVQAQHLGSEIQDYYTLYLGTVREGLAILASFSAEKNHYKKFGAIFDHAIKSLKITADQKQLFPQGRPGEDRIGMQIPTSDNNVTLIEPLPRAKSNRKPAILALIGLVLVGVGGIAWAMSRRKKISRSKNSKSRPK